MNPRLLLVPALLLAGCDSAAPAPPAAAAAPLTPYTRPDKVELTPVSVAEYEAEIKTFAGKVVVVDVWFLGCAPCVKKFPKVVELAGRYADKGVVVASLDLMPDEVADQDKVLAFLTRQDARMPNFIFRDDAAAVDAWQERAGFRPTPAVVIYDRKGERVKTLENPEISDIEAAVAKVLAGA